MFSSKKHDLIKNNVFNNKHGFTKDTFRQKKITKKHVFTEKMFLPDNMFLSIQEFGTDCLGLVYQRFGDCLFLR